MDAGTVAATLRLRDEMTPTLNKAKQALGDMGSTAKTALATFSGFVGAQVAIAGIKQAFSASLGAAMDFNAQMANIASLIPDSTTRVGELKVAVQQMAIATGKSTADLSGGLYQVISAFGNTAESAKILETNARAAAAGVATTTDAINLTSAVTKGYGDTTAAAVAHASDLALMTVRLGQTTFPELARSMGVVVPVAAALKIKQEELFAVMATLTGVTGRASEVSTQMRGALVGLQKPTDEMAAALKKAGFATGEAALESLGYKGTLDALLHAVGNDTNALVKLWGQTESWASIAALAGGQSETFAEKLREMGKAAGTTDVAFKEQTEGINKAGFAWEQTKQRIAVAMQDLGDVVLPELLKAFDAVGRAFTFLRFIWDGVILGIMNANAVVLDSMSKLYGAAAAVTIGPAAKTLKAASEEAKNNARQVRDASDAYMQTMIREQAAVKAKTAEVVKATAAGVPYLALTKDQAKAEKDAVKAVDDWAAGIKSASEQMVWLQSGFGNLAPVIRAQFTREIEDARAALGNLDSTSIEFDLTLKDVIEKARAAAGGLGDLGEKTKEASRDSQILADSFGALSRAAEMAGQKSVAAVASIAQAFAQNGPAGAAAAFVTVLFKVIEASDAANKAAKELKKTMRELQQSYIDAYGSLENLNAMAAATGNAPAAGAGIQRRPTAEYTDPARMTSAFAETIKAWERLQAALDKYGLTMKDVGAVAAEAMGTKAVADLRAAWDALTQAQVPSEKIAGAMAGDIDKLVAQYVAAGVAIPTALQEMLDALNRADEASGGLVRQQIELAAAAKAVTDAMSKYSTNADMAKAADIAGQAYQAMLDSGLYSVDTLSAAWKDWQDALVAAGDEVAIAAKKAREAADAIDQAMGGYKTREQLEATAATAKAVFDRMKASGLYTADVMKQAWDDYQAALVASGDAGAIAAKKAADDLKKVDDQIAALMDSIKDEAPEAEMGAIEKETRAKIDALKKEQDAVRAAADTAKRLSEEAGLTEIVQIQKVKDGFGTLMDDTVAASAQAALDVARQWARAPWADWQPPSGYHWEPGFAGGTHGQYLDFGAGTQVTLHGRERVMTEAEGRSGGGFRHETYVLRFNMGRKTVDAVIDNLGGRLSVRGGRVS